MDMRFHSLSASPFSVFGLYGINGFGFGSSSLIGRLPGLPISNFRAVGSFGLPLFLPVTKSPHKKRAFRLKICIKKEGAIASSLVILLIVFIIARIGFHVYFIIFSWWDFRSMIIAPYVPILQ
jgi:hypothetical protein